MIEVRRADQRYPGGDVALGVETRHAFSFGHHYDPDNVRFGFLMACNEERLAPGAGFAEHPHRDVEIVTYVVEGELEHRDDTAGHPRQVYAGEVARLSAGAGVRHTERNAGDQPLRFVQMWLHPAASGGDPDYEITRGRSPLSLLRQPGARLHVHTAAARLPAAPFVYLHVARGGVRIGRHTLGEGDAARITDASGLAAEVLGAAEYLVWEMTGEPSYG
jgi:quercetin 2,3-dioxygenase